MKSIVKNPYLDALLKLMLLSAIIHIFVLVIYSVLNGNVFYLNFFKIINIDLFFPEIVNLDCYGLYSFVITIWLYILIYYISNIKNKK